MICILFLVIQVSFLLIYIYNFIIIYSSPDDWGSTVLMLLFFNNRESLNTFWNLAGPSFDILRTSSN